MTPNFILLDAGQGLIIIPIFFILHVGSTLLIEGGVLYAMKYGTFKKCTFDAFIANLSSFIIGLFFIFPIQNFVFNNFGYDNKGLNLLILLSFFYLLTIIVEGAALKLLNKTYPNKKLIAATLLINLITYCTLFLILQLLQ